MRIWGLLGVLACASAQAYSGPATAIDFATTVLESNNINGSPTYANPLNALGWPPPLATPAVPDNSKVFSFGWGGFITLGFARPIVNTPATQSNPWGADFIVFGNAFYSGGNPNVAWIEPGQVEVGVDLNGNQRVDAGDVWYRFARRNPMLGLPLPSSFFGSVVVGMNPVVGYADVTPIQNAGDPLIADDPRQPGITPGSAGGDAFDIGQVFDSAGQVVSLRVAHFVRIRHAGNTSLGVFGPSSTEVSAVSIMKPSPSVSSTP